MLKPGHIDTSAASPRSLTRPGAKRTALTATAPVASPLVVTYFFHSDHLGTPKVKTNPAGTVVETWDSYPYGEQWVAGSPGDQHRFTGHLRDSESGNDYAGARYYSNNRGRWLATDPELGDLTNPQRLNRYVYVLNDPINYVDPDGRFARCFHGKRWTVEGWVFTGITTCGEVSPPTRSGGGPGGGGGSSGSRGARPWNKRAQLAILKDTGYVDLSEDCRNLIESFLGDWSGIAKDLGYANEFIEKASESVGGVERALSMDLLIRYADYTGHVDENGRTVAQWIELGFNIGTIQIDNTYLKETYGPRYGPVLNAIILHELAHAGDDDHDSIDKLANIFEFWDSGREGELSPCQEF